MAKSFTDLTTMTTLENGDLFLVRDATDSRDKSASLSLIKSTINPSIGHIDTYLEGAANNEAAITAACDDVESLYFGGTDQVYTSDVTLDISSVCGEIDLQGATLDFQDNAQFLITRDTFTIKNGTIKGGLKQAEISTATGSAPTSFTVNNVGSFAVTDHVAASWSNSYLPNSTARITAPNVDLNRIANIAGNVITLDYAVTTTLSTGGGNILPQGTKIFNARFDKAGIQITGSGTYVFENVHFTEFANAYFLDIIDTTESARVYFRNCKFDTIPLDQFKFRAGQVVFDNCYCDTPLDIAKQNIVWANQNNNGKLALRNCTFLNSSADSFLYGFVDSGNTVMMPDVYIENCTFNGSATMDFSPNQFYKGVKCLHWVSYEQTIDNVNFGKFYAVNSNFIQIERTVLGTTFAEPTVSFSMGEAHFDNCLIDCSPVLVRGSGSTANKVTVTNSRVKHTGFIVFTFMEGVEDYTMIGCTLSDNFPASGTFTEGSNTTTANYPRRSFIERTDTKRRFQSIVSAGTTSGDLLSDDTKFLELSTSVVNGNFIDCEFNDRWLFNDEDTYFERCKFNYISDASNERKPILGNFRQGQLESSFILKGWDTTDSTTLDLSDWFLVNIEPDNLTELDVPLMNIQVEETNAKLTMGGDETAAGQYNYEYIGIRSNPSVGTTAPLTYKGAFLYNPPEGSTVEYSRDRTFKKISRVEDVVLNTGTNGAGTITFTSIGGGATAYAGDWLFLNAAGSSFVRCHEITNVSGTTLTVRPNLGDDYTNLDNASLVKHDWIHGAPLETVEINRGSGVFAISTGSWTTITATNERRNEITYCTTTPSSGTITLPRGKYNFDITAAFVQATGNTSDRMRTSIRLVSSGGKFTSFRGAVSEDETGSTVTAGDPLLSTYNSLSGTFELDDEDTIYVEVYSSIPADSTGADANNDSFNFKVTKIG